MIKFQSHMLSIMVIFAIALHLCWGALVWYDVAAVDVTAVHALYYYFPNQYGLSLLLVVVALLATIGLLSTTGLIVLLLIPQQLLLMASASGAIEAIWIAQFADGTIRPWAFLAADQIYSVLAAIGHTIAVAAHAKRILGNNGK